MKKTRDANKGTNPGISDKAQSPVSPIEISVREALQLRQAISKVFEREHDDETQSAIPTFNLPALDEIIRRGEVISAALGNNDGVEKESSSPKHAKRRPSGYGPAVH